MTNPKSPRRRRKASPDTRRMAAVRACFRHLKDLKSAHGEPPPEVRLPRRSAPPFVPALLEYSWCGSPAAMCAELGEWTSDPASDLASS